MSDDSSAEEELPEIKALNAAKKKLLKSGVKRAPQKLNYCADMEDRISDYKKKKRKSVKIRMLTDHTLSYKNR